MWLACAKISLTRSSEREIEGDRSFSTATQWRTSYTFHSGNAGGSVFSVEKGVPPSHLRTRSCTGIYLWKKAPKIPS
jgi:hypothetical protein